MILRMRKADSSFVWLDVFALLGVSWLFAHSVTLYITFIRAFFNGYKTLVIVNGLGEAGFEFVLLPITLLWGCFGVIYFFRKWVVDLGLLGQGSLNV